MFLYTCSFWNGSFRSNFHLTRIHVGSGRTLHNSLWTWSHSQRSYFENFMVNVSTMTRMVRYRFQSYTSPLRDPLFFTGFHRTRALFFTCHTVQVLVYLCSWWQVSYYENSVCRHALFNIGQPFIKEVSMMMPYNFHYSRVHVDIYPAVQIFIVQVSRLALLPR